MPLPAHRLPGDRKELDETHELISAGLGAIPGLRAGVDTGLSHIDVKGGTTPIVRAEARRKVDCDSGLDADDHPNFRRFQSAEQVAMKGLKDFARRLRPVTDSGVLSSLQPRTSGRKTSAPYRAAELERAIKVKGVDQPVPLPADRGGQRRKVYAATEFLALWHLGTPKNNSGALTDWAIKNQRIPVHKSRLYEKAKQWVKAGYPKTVEDWQRAQPGNLNLSNNGWGKVTGTPANLNKKKARQHLEEQKSVTGQANSIHATRRLTEDSQQAGLDARGVTLSKSASSVSGSLVANNHAYIASQDGTATCGKTAKTTQAR